MRSHGALLGPEHRLVTWHTQADPHFTTFSTMHGGVLGLEKPPVGMYNFCLLLWGWKHPWDNFGRVQPADQTKDVEIILKISRSYWKERCLDRPMSEDQQEVKQSGCDSELRAPTHTRVPVSGRSSEIDPCPFVV